MDSRVATEIRTLSVNPIHEKLTDSPGSSVFDLPIQTSHQPQTTPQTHAHAGPTDGQRKKAEFLVISGGTGCNALCSAFGDACYVLPVSDDGGSSSEIIRVLGGPSVGDIRSRLVRLIPSAPPSSPLTAIKRFLAYRLPSRCSDREARDEWRDIVEGRSHLWVGIPNDRKETIRGFLVYFESELLKRAQKNFDFRNGSIGNYFLAAAQGFFRSLPSAIFLFSSITSSQANIIPVIVTNHIVTIAAELEDGDKIVGQCEISHPTVHSPDISITLSDPMSPTERMDSQRQNILFGAHSKEKYNLLASRISRIYYINAYGMEIRPAPNPEYLAHLASREILVYSCGSLWTSIIPCLALKGVAGGIARSSSLRAKVLLLNGDNDRETEGYTAADYIYAIVRTLNTSYDSQSYGLGSASTTYPVSAFITDLVYLKGTNVRVDVRQITSLGVRCTEVEGRGKSCEGSVRFDAESVGEGVERIMRECWW